MSKNIPAPRGGSKWSASTVKSILRNEKYKGSALLQKSFTVDFLTKTKKKNEGEVTQYYIEDSHPAIVSKEVYELVQMEFEKRSKSRNYKPTASIFSGLMFCGECGSMYGSKVWHSNSKYRCTIWQCNKKFKNSEKCETPHLTEDTVKNAFMSVFNEMIDNMDAVITFVDATIQTLLDTDTIDKKNESAKRVSDKKLTEWRDYVKWSMKTAIKPDEYNRRLDELKAAYESANAVQTQFEQERAAKIERSKRCRAFINQIKDRERLQEFDEALFGSIIEKIMVFRDKLIFEFKDGETRAFVL